MYRGKRRGNRRLSNRCPTACHGGSLCRGGVDQCARVSGACPRFVRILPGCLGGLYFRVRVPGVMIKVAYLTAEAFVLAGVVSSKYHRKRRVVAE